MVYRRSKEGDVWHFCRNCSKWPVADYEESDEITPIEPLCDECKELEEAGIDWR